MPLSAADEKLFNVLANDPEDRDFLLERARKHKEVEDHPAIKAKLDTERQQKPLLEEINNLKKEIETFKKTDFYERERSSLRAGPYRFDDEKIARLEERMTNDKDGPAFKSYRQAAEYYRKMDSPTGPSTASLMPFGAIQSTAETPGQKWRDDMNESDPHKNPLKMSPRERKLYVRKLAKEASDEFKQNIGIM